jgi:outer membrane protein assembly factor BamB
MQSVMRNIQWLSVFVFVFLFVFQGFAQQMVQWRGENRDGIYVESGLLQKWSEKGPEVRWINGEVGEGYAAPAVTKDKLLINGEADSTSYLFAFDLKGKLIWKTPNGREYYGKGFAASFPGSRSTPTVVGDMVYSGSGRGRLAGYELATGKEKWAVDMVTEMGGFENMFGFAESPLVDGDKIYFMPGGPTNNVVALDRFSGKTVWSSKAFGDTTSFCSPIMITLASRKIFVIFSHHYIFGLDAKNGDMLWSQKLENFKLEGEHCNTPVYANGFIYYIAGDGNGNGTVKLELSPDGNSIREVWRNVNVSNAMGGFIKLGNHLFTTTKKKRLVCVDTNTGSVIDSLGANKGSLIYAGNHFYCYNETGEVKLIQFENNKFMEISRFRVDKGTKEHFSHPVIANGTMYIRHGKALIAYDIREKGL